MSIPRVARNLAVYAGQVLYNWIMSPERVQVRRERRARRRERRKKRQSKR